MKHTKAIEQSEQFARVCLGRQPVLFIGTPGATNFELVNLLEARTPKILEQSLAQGRRPIAAVSIRSMKPQTMLFAELDAATIEALSTAYIEHVQKAIQTEFEKLCEENNQQKLIADYRENFRTAAN